MPQVAMQNYYCGDTVTIIASNKPYTDFTTQSILNDYQWADYAKIKIYNEKNELVVNDEMCRLPEKVGWYIYRFKTKCDCGFIGIFRVEITMGNYVMNPCQTVDITGENITGVGITGVGITGVSTSGISGIGTSGTSGNNSPFYLCEDTSVYYFRVNSIY